MQLVHFAFDHKGVARIVTTLKARDHVSPFAQPVYDLSFSFVAPLCADHHYIRHFRNPLWIKPAPV